MPTPLAGYSRFINGGAFFKDSDGSGPYAISDAGVPTLMSGGGGGGGGGDASAALQTAGNATLTSLAKTEDAAHTSGDVGTMSLAVRRDADTTLVGTDGDYAPLQVNAIGQLKATIPALGIRPTSTITRPANTTAYAANDVVGGALTFATVAEAGGTFTLMSVGLMWDFGAIPTGMTAYTLHLYSVTPPSALADNAAWDLPSGDRASYIGSVLLSAVVDLGSTLFVHTQLAGPLVINLGAGQTSLFGYLVTSGAYTPAANSETGSVRLRGYQNA